MRNADKYKQVVQGIYQHKLAMWALSVALIFFLFWEIDAKTQVTMDPYIIFTIGAVKQFIVVMMIAFTRQWTWRAVGVMSVMQGVAVLYLGSGILYWNPELIPTWNEPLADLARSFFIVGVAPLLIGVLSYGWLITSVGIRRVNRPRADGDAWGMPSFDRNVLRDERQDEREDGLDVRADGLDVRADDLDKESFAYEKRRSVLEDREDAMEIREKE